MSADRCCGAGNPETCLPPCFRLSAMREEAADRPPYWFADVDRYTATPPYIWQPCLETGSGHIPSLGIWFESKEICEDWIRDNVIGAGLEDEL